MDDVTRLLREAETERKGPKVIPDYVHVVVPIYIGIVCVVGLLGNMFLVFASYKFTAFNTDKVSVIFIRYLGSLDLCHIVFLVFPAFIHMVHQWVFGKVGCVLFMHVERFLNAAQFNVLLLITYHRLARCVWPVRANKWTVKHAHMVAVGLLVFASMEIPLTSIVLFANDRIQIFYDNTTIDAFGCRFIASEGSGTSSLNWWCFIQNLTDPLIPFILVILGNLFLWIFAIVSTQRIDKKPLLTITLIMVLLTSSFLPLLLDSKRVFFNPRPHTLVVDDVPFLLRQISIIGIPIVYTIFNKPFADFLIKFVGQTLNHGTKKKSIRPTPSGGGPSSPRTDLTVTSIS